MSTLSPIENRERERKHQRESTLLEDRLNGISLVVALALIGLLAMASPCVAAATSSATSAATQFEQPANPVLKRI